MTETIYGEPEAGTFFHRPTGLAPSKKGQLPLNRFNGSQTLTETQFTLKLK